MLESNQPWLTYEDRKATLLNIRNKNIGFIELTDKLICQPESRSKRRRKTSIVANQQVEYPNHISWGITFTSANVKGNLNKKKNTSILSL